MSGIWYSKNFAANKIELYFEYRFLRLTELWSTTWEQE